MITYGYRFQFKEGVNLRDAEDTLLLALLAAEGIYGEARLRLDAAYAIDKALGVIIIDASTEVGQDVAGIFTSFIIKEFGPGAFIVRPLEQEVRS
jgi:hypothetical protein